MNDLKSIAQTNCRSQMQMMQQFDLEIELNQLQFAALQFESINSKKYSNKTTNTSQSAFAAQSNLNYMRGGSQREEREEDREDTLAIIKRCYNCDDIDDHMTSTCSHSHVSEHASLG